MYEIVIIFSDKKALIVLEPDKKTAINYHNKYKNKDNEKTITQVSVFNRNEDLINRVIWNKNKWLDVCVFPR